MKKYLKVVAMIVVMTMAMGLLAACGSSAPANSAPTSAASSAPANSSTPEKSSPAAQKYTIANPPVTYKVMTSMASTQPYEKTASNFKEIARITGINLDVEGIPSGYSDKLNVMLSSNSLPDIVKVNTSNTTLYGPQGAFVPVSNYLDKMPNLKERMKLSDQIGKMYAGDGKLYYFPSFKRYEIVEADVPNIRYDVVEGLGMQLPKSFDELRDVLMAIKKKYPQSYPWTTRTGNDMFEYAAYALGSGKGIYYDRDVDGGKWLYAPAHDDYEVVLKYMADLYSKGLIDPDYATNSFNALLERIGNEKSFFYWDGGGFTLNMNAVLQKTNPKALIAPLPTCLTNYKGQARGQRNRIHYVGEGFAVSSKVKNPEYLIKLFDWFYSDEGADVTNFGAKGIDWDPGPDGKPVAKASLIERFKAQGGDPWRAYMGYLGVGQLTFSVYWDESHKLNFMTDQDKKIEKLMSGNKDLDMFPYSPLFTTDENQKRAKIVTALDTIVTQYNSKILIGELPLSAFKEMQKKLIDAGATELENIYNTAEARTKK